MECGRCAPLHSGGIVLPISRMVMHRHHDARVGMTLIDPQPMETLPEKGYVYVECQYDLIGGSCIKTEIRKAQDIRNRPTFLAWCPHVLAWSYTATTEPEGEGV
jgi:hypothetical protein